MPENVVLTAQELDAIGEILNISMGSAATAVSSMLDKQVSITTPSVEQRLFKEVDCTELEPAIVVKIRYVKGIVGSNTIVFRKHDMQIILNLLMGNDAGDVDENFEFDEMSMSAACEVMNQMMGASATALSEILTMPVDISTPEALLAENTASIYASFNEIEPEEAVAVISFKMMIKDVMDSSFRCFLKADLVRDMVRRVIGDSASEPAPEPAVSTPATPPAPEPTAPSVPTAPAAEAELPLEAMEAMQQPAAPPPAAPVPPAAAAQPPQPAPPQQQPMPQQPQMMPQGDPQQQMMQQQMMMQQMMGMYGNMYGMPYGYGMPPGGVPYAQQGQPGQQPDQPQVNVKKAQFPSFGANAPGGDSLSGKNMNLLMGVPLEVSVVIGKTRKKIKDIMEFGQGTVVELDKQTGAPAEVLVNGQLLAYADVVVIGDNFGIRITEIVGTKELIDSLNGAL